MAEPRSGEATWKFAIMFQIGMIAIGLFLIGISVFTGRSPISAVFGAFLIALAIAGIVYSRRSLRDLRK